jgi:hypothetical protein
VEVWRYWRSCWGLRKVCRRFLNGRRGGVGYPTVHAGAGYAFHVFHAECVVSGLPADKKDWKRNAVKRWLQAHGRRVAALRLIFLRDALFVCQPLAATADFLFVAKAESRKTLHEFLGSAEYKQHSISERKPQDFSYRHR